MPASDQGLDNRRYALVPRTLIFLTCEDRILLIRGAADKRLWAGQYNGLGGHVERGEDILSAARRELFEESGISADRIWLCGLITIDVDEYYGVGIYVFRAETTTGQLVNSQEGTLSWFSTSDIAKLPLVEDLPVILPRALTTQPGQMPFFAKYHYKDSGELMITFSRVNGI